MLLTGLHERWLELLEAAAPGHARAAFDRDVRLRPPRRCTPGAGGRLQRASAETRFARGTQGRHRPAV